MKATRVDGNVLLIGEGEREQYVRSGIGDGETEQAAEAGEKNAFGEQLADDAAALRTERRADGHLGAAAHAADEQQIGNVGAGDEKNESGDPLQQVEMILVVVLHVLDAGAAGREHDVRTAENLFARSVGERLERSELLPEQGAGFGLQCGRWKSRLDAADDVGPLNVSGSLKYGAPLTSPWTSWAGNSWAGAGKAIAVEALGRDADDGDGLGVDPEGAADDGGVGGVILLPGVVAHDGGDGRALLVVAVGEEAAGGRREAEGAEVVAGDELALTDFAMVWEPARRTVSGPPGVAGFHRGQLLEFREILLEHVVGVGGEERVVAVIVPTAVDAAIVGIADRG